MNEKRKLFIISPVTFYNNIGQAGHKTLNYYTSKFENDFDVTVLSLADRWTDDFQLMVKDHPSVKFVGNSRKKSILQRGVDYVLFKYIYPKLKFLNPKYYISNGFNKRRLKKLLKSTDNLNQIDYVLVEFTPMIFQIKLLKKKLPNAKFIASCHDVTFLSVERWLKTNNVLISNAKFYQSFKHLELQALNQFDLVVTHNIKDEELLMKDNSFTCKELHVINPYFDTYNSITKEPDGIVFFGAMNRKENLDSLIWFLQNVWAKISESHLSYLKLYVIGGGVTNSLRKACNYYKNIIITGFVLDPTTYFNKSFAMVVPLQFGAGIKVKSIEAMASGIPLISNEIGIEGIPAVAGKDYMHCETYDEWIDAVDSVCKDIDLRKSLTSNGLNLVNTYFNLERSYIDYKNRICKL